VCSGLGALAPSGRELRCGRSPPPALADPAQTRVCLDLELGPELWDASPRQADDKEFGEDYGRWEGSHPFPAQRWLARVIDDNSGQPLWGFAPLDEDGCTGATADIEYDDESPTFTVQYVKWAHWSEGDRSIVGYGCMGTLADPTCNFQVPLAVSGVEAVPSGTTYATVDDSVVFPEEHPLWAASFCEEHLPLHDDFDIYLLFDPSGHIQDGTGTNNLFSGHPTVVFKGNGWHSKFTACHEYGHFQTFLFAGVTPSDIDYRYDPNNPTMPHVDDQHSFESPEWQSAASVEGVANFYAAASWSNIDRMGSVPYVEMGSAETSYTERPIPRGSCLIPSGPNLGVANEWNWASALRWFRLEAQDTPSLPLIIGMVERAYDGGQAGWVATGDLMTSAFWDNFVAQMDGYLLDQQQEDDWADAADQWCIDQ
jgi:hypothetical protein